MAKWTPFPHAGDYAFDAASVKKQWAKLHQGDCEPLPKDAAVLQAWVLFHNGDFQKAAEAGIKAGGDGITVANKATGIYANYLEAKEKSKLDLFMEVADRAEAQQAADHFPALQLAVTVGEDVVEEEIEGHRDHDRQNVSRQEGQAKRQR